MADIWAVNPHTSDTKPLWYESKRSGDRGLFVMFSVDHQLFEQNK